MRMSNPGGKAHGKKAAFALPFLAVLLFLSPASRASTMTFDCRTGAVLIQANEDAPCPRGYAPADGGEHSTTTHSFLFRQYYFPDLPRGSTFRTTDLRGTIVDAWGRSLSQCICSGGKFPDFELQSGQCLIGQVVVVNKASPPQIHNGTYARADGSKVKVTDYPALYSVIGLNFTPEWDGESFHLPDLSRSLPAGQRAYICIQGVYPKYD